MIETITGADGKRLAFVVRKAEQTVPTTLKTLDQLNPKQDGLVVFFSENEDSLQLGVMSWPEGYHLAPHIHNPSNRLVSPAEVLFVFSGRVRADIYEDHPEPDLSMRQSVELSAGDVLVLLGGGHGFEILEDAVVWEVKTGPYLPTDKVWLAGPSKHSPPPKVIGTATPCPES